MTGRLDNRACSITSVAYGEGADPSGRFRTFREAGFTHVHWADHCWNAAHHESEEEIAAIQDACHRHDLKIVDLHGIEASGTDARFTDECWLDANSRRVALAAALDADCIVLHPAEMPPDASEAATFETTIRRLEQLQPVAERRGIRIAVENVYVRPPSAEFLERVFDHFDASYVGFCFDSGHALMTNRMHLLATFAERLFALHLHDNDGVTDQHRIPGEGSIDWPTLVKPLRSSPYAGPLTLEVIKSADAEASAWCRKAFGAIGSIWNTE